MNVVLGMIVKNELPILTKTAPINVWPHMLAVDFGSTDGTKEFLEQHRWKVVSRPWPNDYSIARNTLIDCAKEYDAIVMLDADECFFPSHVSLIIKMLNEQQMLHFPRWNLCHDNNFVADHYPDFQFRAFRLHCGYHYKNKLHESLVPQDVSILAPFHIFHYGWCKPPNEIALKNHNYNLLRLDQPMTDKFDGDYVFPHKSYPFYLSHPLQS